MFLITWRPDMTSSGVLQNVNHLKLKGISGLPDDLTTSGNLTSSGRQVKKTIKNWMKIKISLYSIFLSLIVIFSMWYRFSMVYNRLNSPQFSDNPTFLEFSENLTFSNNQKAVNSWLSATFYSSYFVIFQNNLITTQYNCVSDDLTTWRPDDLTW
jgi:hypothetical protein